MLMGIGGAIVQGTPSTHYKTVKDSCVTCHMGGKGVDASHSFMPNVATCQQCHKDAKDLNVNGVQATITKKLDDVKKSLTAKGLLDKTGTIVPGDYKTEYSAALWNYLFVEEDKSKGVHNPDFANALLDAALTNLSK